MSRTMPEATATLAAAERATTATPARGGRLGRRVLMAGVVAAWVVVPASLAVVLYVNRQLDEVGRPELAQPLSDGVVYIMAMFSAATVGAALAMRRPRHPVGWLFLAQGGVLAVGTALISYAAYGAMARPGSLPVAAAAGVVGDSGFPVWFVLIALISHLTIAVVGAEPPQRGVDAGQDVLAGQAPSLGARNPSGRSLSWPAHSRCAG
jgi:hypothetical protein